MEIKAIKVYKREPKVRLIIILDNTKITLYIKRGVGGSVAIEPNTIDSSLLWDLFEFTQRLTELDYFKDFKNNKLTINQIKEKLWQN